MLSFPAIYAHYVNKYVYYNYEVYDFSMRCKNSSMAHLGAFVWRRKWLIHGRRRVKSRVYTRGRVTISEQGDDSYAVRCIRITSHALDSCQQSWSRCYDSYAWVRGGGCAIISKWLIVMRWPRVNRHGHAVMTHKTSEIYWIISKRVGVKGVKCLKFPFYR